MTITFSRAERDSRTAAFFEAAARNELLVHRCADCGHWAAPQALRCTQCGAAPLGWEAASGTGTVVAWAVAHARPVEGQAASSLVLGLVELDEGPWLHARIVDADPTRLRSRAAVRVDFHHPDDGESLPYFRLREDPPT